MEKWDATKEEDPDRDLGHMSERENGMPENSKTQSELAARRRNDDVPCVQPSARGLPKCYTQRWDYPRVWPLN